MPFTASEAEIVKQTLEGLRADLASMRQGSNGWKGYAAEWVKPPVILALIVTFVSVSGTVLYFRDTLRTAAEDNDRKDRSIESVSATLAPIPRLLERLTNRMESHRQPAEGRASELAGVAEGRGRCRPEEPRHGARHAGEPHPDDGVDTRISRVVEMFQNANKETNAEPERILMPTGPKGQKRGER
ncbi:hypothetical protein ACIKTA_02480 [Hansschlegelia beijingensis]